MLPELVYLIMLPELVHLIMLTELAQLIMLPELVLWTMLPELVQLIMLPELVLLILISLPSSLTQDMDGSGLPDATHSKLEVHTPLHLKVIGENTV
jgi:hypothetical protein